MRIGILGVYPEGAESRDSESVRGKWSPWRLPSQAPYKLWQHAEAELRRCIKRYGSVGLYVYWGHNTPIEQVLRVDDLWVGSDLTPAPGPTFPDYDHLKSRVWIRYAATEMLPRPLKRDDFREVPLLRGCFANESRRIGELSWSQMHHTGLTFVEDSWAR